MSAIGSILAHRDLLWNLVGRDLKSRYRGSAVGFLWTVLNPLFMAVIYIFFLRLLAGRRVPIPFEDIIIGVFAWQFTVQCINAGSVCFTGNANLVKKVFFPRIILPVSVVLSSLVNFVITLFVQFALLAVILALQGSALSLWTVALPAVVLYHALFNLALVLLVSTANVYFRDTPHLTGLLLSAWFFVSPVMYPLSFVQEMARSYPWIGDLYMLNPLSAIITAYRALQVPAESFPWSAGSVAGWVWPALLFALAYSMFRRSQRYFSDIL